jgi:poly-gamma-glutamate capsule biosynthesis protein CapA/YwtB (metallophosphatase superfamily)
VDYPYPWGDALKILNQAAPDVRIINLETAVTRSNDPWPGKSIHYRMHPQNVPCLTVAGIDCCVIANNHVLDWSYAGLAETLTTLHQANLKTRLSKNRFFAVIFFARKWPCPQGDPLVPVRHVWRQFARKAALYELSKPYS